MTQPDTEYSVSQIPVTALTANPDNPRRVAEADDELVASIAAVGILSPLIVRPNDDGSYMLVAGHRRTDGAFKAGLEVVPAIVRNLTDEQVTEIALIENLQRENLDPLEEARGFFRLTVLGQGRTIKEIATRIGRSQSYVSDRLALLSLPRAALDALQAGALNMGQVKHILTAINADASEEDIAELVEHGKDGNDLGFYVERLVASLKQQAVIDKAREKAEAAGVPFYLHRGSLYSLPATVRPLQETVGETSVKVPEFTGEGKHSDEPCHGVALVIPSYGGKPVTTKVCVDFTRHSKKGESPLKEAADVTAAAEKAAAREERQRVAALAAERQAALTAMVRGAKLNSPDVRAIVLNATLSSLTADDQRAVASLLELEPDLVDNIYGERLKSGELKKVKDFGGPLLRFVRTSTANATRAQLAIAVNTVAGAPWHYGPSTEDAKVSLRRLLEATLDDVPEGIVTLKDEAEAPGVDADTETPEPDGGSPESEPDADAEEDDGADSEEEPGDGWHDGGDQPEAEPEEAPTDDAATDGAEQPGEDA